MSNAQQRKLHSMTTTTSSTKRVDPGSRNAKRSEPSPISHHEQLAGSNDTTIRITLSCATRIERSPCSALGRTQDSHVSKSGRKDLSSHWPTGPEKNVNQRFFEA